METISLLQGGQIVNLSTVFNDSLTYTGLIEWPEPNKAPYPFVTNELHIPLCGKAEYTFTYAPEHNEEVTRDVAEGDIVLIRFGTYLSIRPIEEPYRCVYVMMPTQVAPDYFGGVVRDKPMAMRVHRDHGLDGVPRRPLRDRRRRRPSPSGLRHRNAETREEWDPCPSLDGRHPIVPFGESRRRRDDSFMVLLRSARLRAPMPRLRRRRRRSPTPAAPGPR